MQRHCLNYLYLTVFLILCGIYPQQAVAEGEITLEHNQHWAAISDESGPFRVTDICSGDINDGAGPAIISLSTRLVDGMAHAELRIARWDGSVFEVLDEQSWYVASQDTYFAHVRGLRPSFKTFTKSQYPATKCHRLPG